MAANTNPKARRVLESFNALPTSRPTDVVVSGNPGVEAVKSHVQGVATLGNGYLLTHSNVEGEAGRLVMVDGHRNGTTITLPAFTLDGVRLPHPGGCQRIGDYLVIPFEAIEKNVSRVSIFDVSTATPVELPSPAPIERHEQKAGCAGIANVTIDGQEYWYLAIYDNGRVDVFRTDSHVFPGSEFAFQFTSMIPDGYESLSLVAEDSNLLFAAAFRLDSFTRDKADLYAVHLDTQRLELLESRRFMTKVVHTVRFRWGSALEVRPDGTLALLCTGRNFLPSLKPHCHINIFGVRS